MHRPRIERRQLLQGAGAGLGASLVGCAQVSTAGATPAAAPSAFDVGTESALIRVQAARVTQARVDFGRKATLGDARPGPIVNLKTDTDFAATVRLDGLTPGQTWFYRVIDPSTRQPMSAIGRFKTAPAIPRPFVFAFSSCMHHDHKPFSLFDEIGKRDPDFFLHLGDTVYADQPRKQFVPSVAYYRRKHAINRQDEALQRFLLRHGTWAIWDDHEIENGAHAGHRGMADAMKVFREFWPCEPAASSGLYRRFGWAGIDFFILDLRSFRSPQSMADGARKTMLGTTQKDWFLDGLRASTAPYKFVLSSVPFHGNSDDAWGVYASERDQIAAFIRRHRLRGVVFLTGDYHMARDMSSEKTGLQEYMAGPIAQRPYYQRNPENRARVAKAGRFHYGDGNNFGLVSVDPRAERAELTVVGADGGALFSVDLRT